MPELSSVPPPGPAASCWRRAAGARWLDYCIAALSHSLGAPRASEQGGGSAQEVGARQTGLPPPFSPGLSKE